jgi:Poly(R)-hydroxyalkanoic acid synthase subunit (PHA_synth_III_E)
MTAQNPVQDAFEIWKKALEDGTQAWVRAIGQSPIPQAAPGTPDFSQFWRPILGQGMELWQKAAAQGGVSPEFAQQWKTFMDQWIDAWSRALGQAMATEGFAQALGRYLDQTLTAQGPMRKGMEQYTDQALRTLGLPSRAQVVGVASQIVALEERIEGLEDRLDEIRRLLDQATGPAPTTPERSAPAAERPGRSKGGSPGRPPRSSEEAR